MLWVKKDFRSSRKCVLFWGVQLKDILQFPDNSRNTNQCKKGDETSGKCEVVTFFLSKVSMCSPPFCSWDADMFFQKPHFEADTGNDFLIWLGKNSINLLSNCLKVINMMCFCFPRCSACVFAPFEYVSWKFNTFFPPKLFVTIIPLKYLDKNNQIQKPPRMTQIQYSGTKKRTCPLKDDVLED